MVSLSLRPEASYASCGPIVIIRSRREGTKSEEEFEEGDGESEEDEEDGEGEEDGEEDEGSAAGNPKGIVPQTEEVIAATSSTGKEEKKKAKAAAGLNDEDADLPVNANHLPVKNMAISDINAPREPSRKERFVHFREQLVHGLTSNQGSQREARSKGAVLEGRRTSVVWISALNPSLLVASRRQDRPS